MFASLQNKRKLEEATSAKEDVAPVYLLEEIWELLRSSPPDVVASMVSYANNRLSNKSPIVKQKTCRLIKYICAKGSSEFKRSISKHAASVRELTSYKGDPDPFKGDVPNQRVRDAAKEALDAMFAATDPSYTASSNTPSLTNRIQGFGSSADPTGGPGVSSSSGSSCGAGVGSSTAGSRMMGFGNPKFDNSLDSRASASSVVSPKAILGSMVDLANQARSALPQGRSKSFLRGDEQGGYSSGDDGGGGGGYTQPRLDARAGPYGPPSAGGGLAATSTARDSSGADEERLVDGICTPGGLRAQPDREDLRLFVESAAGLSGPRIAELLGIKMGDPSWQVVLRALCALEAVIQQGSSAACGEIAIHFQAEPGLVRRAAASPQASLKQRAKRVLQLLGAEAADGAPAARKATTGAPAAAAGGPDLLGDLLGGEPQSLPVTAPHGSAAGADLLGDLLGAGAHAAPGGLDAAAQKPSMAAGLDDMFGGLSVGVGGSQATVASGGPAGGSLFGGLDLGLGPSANGAAPHGNPGGDLLGGLAVGVGPSAAAGATMGPGRSGAGSAALDPDLFGGLSTPGPPAAHAPSGSNGLADMLGGLSQGPRPQTGASLAGLGLIGGMPQPLGGLAAPVVPPQMQFGGLGPSSGFGTQAGPHPAYGQMQYGRGLAEAGYPVAQAGYGQMQYGGGLAAGQHPGYGTQGSQAGAAPLGGFPQPGVAIHGNQSPAAFGGPGGGMYGKPSGAAGSMFDGLLDGGPVSKELSSVAGLTKESTFDFVGDHMSTLRSQK